MEEWVCGSSQKSNIEPSDSPGAWVYSFFFLAAGGAEPFFFVGDFFPECSKRPSTFPVTLGFASDGSISIRPVKIPAQQVILGMRGLSDW